VGPDIALCQYGKHFVAGTIVNSRLLFHTIDTIADSWDSYRLFQKLCLRFEVYFLSPKTPRMFTSRYS